MTAPVLELTAQIDLPPQYHWMAGLPPSPRPAPGAFSREQALARLRKGITPRYNNSLDWRKVEVPTSLSVEEARFWLLAMTEPAPYGQGQAVVRAMEQADLAAAPDVLERLRAGNSSMPLDVVRAVEALLGAEATVELMLSPALSAPAANPQSSWWVSRLPGTLVGGFHRFIRPHLDADTVARLREIVRERAPGSLWTQATAPSDDQVVAYRLAPLLGMARECLAIVNTWPDGLFPRRNAEEYRRVPKMVILGLGDAALAERHLRRLGLLPRNGEEALQWLAVAGTRGVSLLADAARASASARHAVVPVLCRVWSPEAAPALLRLRVDGYGLACSREWFETQVGNAVAGLVPHAVGRGKVPEAARAYLREVRQRGLGEAVERELARLDEAGARKLRAAVLEGAEPPLPELEGADCPWLSGGVMGLPSPERPAAPPAWLALQTLPPLTVGPRRLADHTVRLILAGVASMGGESVPELFPRLREHVPLARREAFAWAVVDQWRDGGEHSRDNWVLRLPALLGGDESARRLAGLVRGWGGNTNMARARKALDALAGLNNAVAVQQLAALARSLRSRALRAYAQQLVQRVAERRGLSPEIMEDQAVPTLGFEAGRGPTFDFGPRRFEAVMAPGPRLLVRTEAGQLREDLPGVGKRDDAARSREAVEAWRALKKLLKDVCRDQAARLERAMVRGQSWPLAALREQMLPHPVLGQLARQLLWAGDGRVLFRANDEGHPVGPDEGPVSLEGVARVTIAHPIEMGEDERRRWQEVWRDHEIVQPFPQLGRRLFPRDGLEGERFITGFDTGPVQALVVSGLLKSLDWRPVRVGAKGGYAEGHAVFLPGPGLTAVLHHPHEGRLRYPNPQAEQRLQRAFFLRGELSPRAAAEPEGAVLLGEAPLLAWSEVCEALARVAAKART